MPVTPGATPTEVNLNSTNPAAPAGQTNVVWQSSTAYPDPNDPEKYVRDVTAYSPVGSLPLTIGFVMNTGAAGTNVGPELAAPRAGSINKCKVVVKASDPSTDLTFRIKQNGSDVFSTDPTVTHGTAAGTVLTFTSLTSSPLSVAADDVFTIDVTSGTSAWEFTTQLET